MAQRSTPCASRAVELRKLREADVSDDDASSRSTRSGSPSERSSGASQTTFTRSFVWADEDSDDDVDVAYSVASSAWVGNQQSISGGNPPFAPSVPPGCHQPFNSWMMNPSFVPCAPSTCFAQPIQFVDAGWPSKPVNQPAVHTPAVRSQPLQANAEADALEAQAESYAARAHELREAARHLQRRQAEAASRETLAGPGSLPKSNVAAEQFAGARDGRTTLIVKNLPAGCSHDGLRKLLDDVGFAGLYNFMYVPFDFKRSVSLRYGFVNFEHPENAVKAAATLDGFSGWVVDGEKACEVEWSGSQQGLHANIERYRNSPVMHSSVPDAYKPVLFERGVRIEFPAPTQAVKPLKFRRAQQAKAS